MFPIGFSLFWEALLYNTQPVLLSISSKQAFHTVRALSGPDCSFYALPYVGDGLKLPYM